MLDRVRSSPWLLPLVLTAVAAVTLFVRLGEPGDIIFDETYYVSDANSYLEIGVEDSFAVHPPVGKWLIALGIALFGDNPFGWRAAAALAGTATVLLTYLIGHRLLRDRAFAALAAVLLLTDGLFVVQARTSMLDIFLALFVALAAWALLIDHDRRRLSPEHDPAVEDRPPSAQRPESAGGAEGPGEPDHGGDVAADGGSATADAPIPSGGSVDEVPTPRAEPSPEESAETGGDEVDGRYRWLVGVAIGLAIATKWSGLLGLGAAGLVVLGWELAARHRRDGGVAHRLPQLVGSVAATLVLVPAAVYLVSYLPWLIQYDDTSPSSSCEPEAGADVTVADRFEGLWCYHGAVWDFHRGLEADHPYRAPAYSWPVLARPVVYHWETCKGDRAAGVPTENEDGELVEPEPCVVDEGEAAEVIALGNPALWWLFLPGAIPLLAGAVGRDRRAWFVVAFWGAQFVPWLLPPLGDRPVFVFYMTPVVPFLALGLAYAARYVAERRDLTRPALGALVGGAGALGLAFAAGEGLPDRWLWAGVAYVAGAMVGGVVAARRGDLEPREVPAGWHTGYTVAAAIGVLAVAAFVYFYPVWTGLPLPEEAIRQRWWIQPGWI